MKKFLLPLLITIILSPGLFAQKYDNLRPAALGISFVLNDFKTPQYIRNYSLTATFRDKQFAKINEMGPGIAISYFKGLTNHIDFAGMLMASSVAISLPDKTNVAGDNFFQYDAFGYRPLRVRDHIRNRAGKHRRSCCWLTANYF